MNTFLPEGDEDLSLYQAPEVPTKFITGPAGTGKTFRLLQQVSEDPSFGVLCATTGVAAVNLGTITINSLLRYFDTDSLQDRYMSGSLRTSLANLVRDGKRNLIIDEISMMEADQLDLIYRAAEELAQYQSLPHPLGIIATGDFCQIPPVNGSWAFQADCWPRFEANTERLTEIRRQTDIRFLESLQAARRGDGALAVDILKSLDVEFAPMLDPDFIGTTIVPDNAKVDAFNYVALKKVPTKQIGLKAIRKGKQRGEWTWSRVKGTGIPDFQPVKIGSLVMILSNDVPAFSYVNGELGHIRGTENKQLQIELLRNKALVSIPPLTRLNTQRDKPFESIDGMAPFQDRDGNWAVGQITYYPVRPGYAITTHKSQGLTLDRVQIDARGQFFGSPNMMYVALSRVRSPKGLRIVGTPETLAKRINVAPEVVRWL
jgi:ATP-dependent DNA helicase PIF1